jgi:hypothetical protein
MKLGLIGKILITITVILCVSTVSGTVSISSNFYNSEGDVGISESIDNACFAGSIELLPYSGFNDYPYSIFAKGSGSPNGGSATTKHSSQLTASDGGKTVIADSMLRQDPAMKSVVKTTWGHQVIIGDPNGDSSLYQFTRIESLPGYMTYPTSSSRTSVTAGMTYQAFDNKGIPLFDLKYVPPMEFGEPRITLGVMKSEYADVKMVTNLKVSAKF